MSTIVAAAPIVCTPPPPGQCPIVLVPGCIYPAEVINCAKPVPINSAFGLWLLVCVLIVIAVLALRSKP